MLSKLSVSAVRSAASVRWTSRSVSTLAMRFTAPMTAVSRVCTALKGRCACGCSSGVAKRTFVSPSGMGSDRDLAGILQRESEELEANEKPPEPNVPYGWKINENIDEVSVRLTRTVGDEEIRVSFKLETPDDSYPDMSQYSDEMDPNQQEGEGEQGTDPATQEQADQLSEEAQESAENDGNPYSGFIQEFHVHIHKPKINKAIYFKCVSVDGALHVNRIVNIPDAKVALAETSEAKQVMQSYYQGPATGELDGDLMGRITDYLARRGIDDDLAKYVMDYAVFKESGSYTKWVNTILEFVRPSIKSVGAAGAKSVSGSVRAGSSASKVSVSRDKQA